MKKALALSLTLALISAAPAALALVGPGQAMPQISLPDTQGKLYSLNQLSKDKVALIVYWSVSCPHCRAEIPGILSLARRLEGNPLVVLFVNTDGKAMAPAVEAFAQQEGIPAPWLQDLGPDDAMPLADAYDLIATPAVLVINPQGVLVLAQELKPDLKQVKRAITDSF